jgi:8-amino-7-oxononanoate synthase
LRKQIYFVFHGSIKEFYVGPGLSDMGEGVLCKVFCKFPGNFSMREEDFLSRRLKEREEQDALRRLRLPEGKIDLCSNDYLGVVRNGLLEDGILMAGSPADTADAHGSGGSRLLAGNYPLIEETERVIAAFHGASAGLIYNSGYDANLGLLSSVPQRGDVVLYDSLSHASIRDGIRLSLAQAYGFAHNDLGELENRLRAARDEAGAGGEVTDGRGASGSAITGGGRGPGAKTVFVVTESVFSMDGDLAPLEAMAALCRKYAAQLIVDEAHATGVVGARGEGLVQALALEKACFARIHTFGKAVGCHGAVVLGSERLREYLINFSRSFIYTTALPPASVRAIAQAYALLPRLDAERERLRGLIARFRQTEIGWQRLDSTTPIQVVIVPGNAAVKALANRLQEAGLDVRPILSPTVEKGKERLRIVLHAFNTDEEIDRLTRLLGE